MKAPSLTKGAVKFAFAFFVITHASTLLAQVDRGSIVGTVSDSSGAYVEGAKVVLKNLATDESVQITTDSSGAYAANLLRIGAYLVTVEKQGFKKAVRPSVEVSVNQVVRVDLTLQVGSAAESVEVTGAAPLLQTETSSLGTIETERRISDLPLNGRNFIQLAYLGPGANSGQTGSNVSGGVFENERANEALSVNGLRVSNNNFLLNGVDNNEFGLGGVVVLPPPDAIQEFRTEENSMSAEFGRGGAAVNVVVKSGTNQIHGGAFEFIRNDKLDARNYFAQPPAPKPAFKRNQFGAFLGGPIKKDKTFIFGDYQGSRVREGLPYISTVPNAAERAGDFSDRLTGQSFSPCPAPGPGESFDTGTIFNPFSTHNYACINPDLTTGQPVTVQLRDPISYNGQPNVIPPTMIDPTGSNIVNLYPMPNNSGLFNNYFSSPSRMNDQDSFDIRLDHHFREQDQIFGGYSFDDIRSLRPGPLGDLGGASCCPSRDETRAQHISLGWTHTFSARLLNDAHGGFFRYAVNALPLLFGKNLSQQVGIPNANRGDVNSSGLSFVDVASFTPLGDSLWTPEHAFENIFQVADTVTWVRNKHSFKFGIDFRRQQRNFFQLTASRGQFSFPGGYTADLTTSTGGNGLADLLLGIPNSSSQDFLTGLYPTRYWDLAEFVQDDFHVLPNLTLNIGLRYEVTSPANGRVGNFDLDRAVVVNSYGPNAVSHAGVKFDKSDWAPRIGLAWSLQKQTVVHSAFGIFYSSEGNIFDDLGLNPPALAFASRFFNVGQVPAASQFISAGFSPTIPFADPSHPTGVVRTTGPVRRMPRILEWNLGIQHEFSQNWVAQIGYVGTRAYHLWNHEVSDLNQPLQPLDSNFSDDTGNFGRPYFNVLPDLSNILPLDFPQLQMFYNAFQTSLNKRFSSGFNFLASYTLAHNLGNADGNVGAAIQDAHHPEREYGPVLPDLRHRFVVSYLYELPVGRGRHFLSDLGRVADGIIGGWQIGGITSAQSGEAFTAGMSGDLSNTGSGSYRPDQIGNPYDFSVGTAEQANLGCDNPGQQTLTCWYNQAVFVTPALAPGQQVAHLFGNSRIGNLRGPKLVNVDFVLQKSFKLHETHQIEFRSEFFNMLNHPNFGLPGNTVDQPGGASITGTATDNRQIEFALKYKF
jgi:Carboxypeptidase regulatory-like domain